MSESFQHLVSEPVSDKCRICLNSYPDRGLTDRRHVHMSSKIRFVERISDE